MINSDNVIKMIKRAVRMRWVSYLHHMAKKGFTEKGHLS